MLFTKMHGLGNDFIVIEDMDDKYEDYGKLAARMCHRHFGVGGDGILVVKKSNIADSKMLIYNSDGSSAEMCGNGVRCFAKYLYDNRLVYKSVIDIETLDGIKKVEIEEKDGLAVRVKVNMGRPVFEPHLIPINIDKERVVNESICIDGENYSITSMFMGVPHTILFVDDIHNIDIKGIGEKVEKSRYFPNRTNVNFVKVINRNEFEIRTWERGAGATLACGTGTCASLIAGVLNDKTEKSATAHLLGGDLFIEWGDDGCVYMTGPAETVFKGECIAI